MWITLFKSYCQWHKLIFLSNVPWKISFFKTSFLQNQLHNLLTVKCAKSFLRFYQYCLLKVIGKHSFSSVFRQKMLVAYNGWYENEIMSSEKYIVRPLPLRDKSVTEEIFASTSVIGSQWLNPRACETMFLDNQWQGVTETLWSL